MTYPDTQLSADIETAIEMLELIFSSSKDVPFITPFCAFLQAQKEYKAINKDQWNSLLEFCVSAREDLTDYDDNASCKFDNQYPPTLFTNAFVGPLMMDEFVVWAREEYPQQFPTPETVDTF